MALDSSLGLTIVSLGDDTDVAQRSAPGSASLATTCLLDDYTHAMLNALPQCPRPITPTADQSYYIRKSSNPSAGLGLFSRHEMQAGDLILSERPLAVAPASVLGVDNRKLLEGLVERMDAATRTSFFALANCYSGDPLIGRSLGIFRTNGIGLGDTMIFAREPDDPAYVGVFANASRINHSCCPSAAYHFDLHSFMLHVYATRRIAADEEIHVSYCANLLERTSMRRQALQSYGFCCTCLACANSDISDVRRARVDTSVTLHMPPEKICVVCEEQIALLEAEGLQLLGEYVEHALFLVIANIALGHEDRAAEYKEKARRWEIAIRGRQANFTNTELARQTGLNLAATRITTTH
ncbi:hypothetical protein BD626DRAFT_118922 [Schizophyllum amplum]|uniref:SET domain-containing protein n=1 Tax=Schizophyllum amplum TaxID=97359 RepID=A0A550CUZ3_9AGAR|nr:hypothetical protein BD626DRAFT_118922 [Auriculariopsis ampla]